MAEKGKLKVLGDKKLKIEYQDCAKLIISAGNSRSHPDFQIDQIAASIREFGFTSPVLIDEAMGVIAGHGRLAAAKKVGMDRIPCIKLDGLSERDKRLLMIADNRIAQNAKWDEEILALELSDLIDLGAPVELTGFSDKELKAYMAEDPVETVEEEGEAEAETAGAANDDFAYQFGVVVVCQDEEHQAETYKRLRAEGFNCRPVSN